jgi:hypothetical protein
MAPTVKMIAIDGIDHDATRKRLWALPCDTWDASAINDHSQHRPDD